MKREKSAAKRWIKGENRSGRCDFLRVGGTAEVYRKRQNQEVESLSDICRKEVLKY